MAGGWGGGGKGVVLNNGKETDDDASDVDGSEHFERVWRWAGAEWRMEEIYVHIMQLPSTHPEKDGVNCRAAVRDPTSAASAQASHLAAMHARTGQAVAATSCPILSIHSNQDAPRCHPRLMAFTS